MSATVSLLGFDVTRERRYEWYGLVCLFYQIVYLPTIYVVQLQQYNEVKNYN